MAMKRTLRRGLASPAICWGLGIWTAVGGVLSAPALVQQPGSGVEGRWAGSVVLPTGELPFSVTFERADGALSATMDIPAQSVLDLLLTAVSYADGRVHFELQAPIGLAVWDGAHEGDTIEGEFTQGAASWDVFRRARRSGRAGVRRARTIPREGGLLRDRRRAPRRHPDPPRGDGALPGGGHDHGVGTAEPGRGTARFPRLPGHCRPSHAAGDRGPPVRRPRRRQLPLAASPGPRRPTSRTTRWPGSRGCWSVWTSILVASASSGTARAPP